jgi:hypothetical protein
MNGNGRRKIWELAPDDLIGLGDARGATLRVTRGTLWVTLEHDTRDVVLAAGDAFTIDRGGLTLIQAHGRTTVCVQANRVEARRIGQHHPTLAARLSRWLARIGNAGLTRGWAPYA